MIFDALLDDVQIHFKVEMVDSDRIFHIEFGGGDRHEGKNDIALLDVIFNPFPIDRNVPLDKVKTRILQCFPEAIVGKVHAVNGPVRLGERPLRQVVTDKAVYPQDQDVHWSRIPSLSLK